MESLSTKVLCRYPCWSSIGAARVSTDGASARAALTADSIFASPGFGWASRTARDVISGSGAGALTKICTGSECRVGSGRPVRWLVTIAGEPFLSRAASARNSNATSTEPEMARKARTRIVPGSIQKEMLFKINRPIKRPVSERPKTRAVTRSAVFVMTLIPAFRFLFSAGKLERDCAVAPAYGGSPQV